MIQWFKDNKEFLSLTAIEKHLGMPQSTLTKAVNGSQKLSTKWNEPLKEFKGFMCGTICECEYVYGIKTKNGSPHCKGCGKKVAD